jgi:hypothetical protein
MDIDGMGGVLLADVVDAAVEDLPPVVHHEHSIGHLLDLVHHVGGHDDRLALILDLVHELLDEQGVDGIET